jgi:ubiquinone/menaquinone biosynthesis C-methylase UbiE
MTRDYTEPDIWWDEYERSYAARSWHNARPLLSAVVSHGFGGPLLDVGAGCGFLIECARRFGIEAIGVEGSSKAVSICREKHPLADIRPWRGGTDLPVDSNSIGVAVANEFVDHITMEQNASLFREIHRVLKPDGILIVNSPSRHNSYDQDLGHVSFFSPSEFSAFVRSFSFRILEQPYIPQPFLGNTRLGHFAMYLVSRVYQPEKWAARIDLVAQKA